MATPYTHTRLTELEDMAKKSGIEIAEARFATSALDAEDTGVSHHRLLPNARQPFGHKHERAEEVYVVISGSGRVKLDDDVVELERLDALRVAPQVMRNFEAGPDGIEWLAFGPRHEGDAEVVPGWWSD